MALEAGSVFVKLGALFSRDDFQKWDAAVDQARRKSKDPVEVKLDAKTTQAERKIAVVEELLKRYNKERASATLDIDKRNFDRKIIEAETQLKALRAAASKSPFASLAADAERAGVKLENLGKSSENAGKKLNLLAPIFTGVGRAIRSTNSDMDSFLGRLGRAASEAGRGGTGLGGLASSAAGAFGKLPWWLQGAPALLPAGASVVGSAGALIGSAGAAAAGAGALGAGALGAGGVGIAALMAGFKPAESELKNVQKAYDALTTAQQKYGDNSKQAQAAQKNLNAVMKDSSPAFLQVVKDMKSFEEEWQSKTKPAVQAFGGIFADVFGQLRKHADDFAKIVNGVAEGLRKALRPVIGQLFGPDVMSNFRQLAGAFSSMLGPALDGAVKLFRAFLNVAVATIPYLKQIVNAFDAWAGRVLHATQDQQKLHDIVAKLVSQFMSWVKLFEALGRLMITFFSGGAAQGQKMVDKLTQILDKWNAWLRANPEKLQHFFSESVHLLGDIFKALGPIVVLFGKLSISLMPAFAKLLEALSPVVNTILGALAKVVGWVAQLVSHNEPLKIMLGTVLAMGAAWKAITFAGKITGITQLIGLFGKLKVAAGEAAVAEEAAGGAGAAGAAGAAGGVRGLLSRVGGLGGGAVGRVASSGAVQSAAGVAAGIALADFVSQAFSAEVQKQTQRRASTLASAIGLSQNQIGAITNADPNRRLMSPTRTNLAFGDQGNVLVSEATSAIKSGNVKELDAVIQKAKDLQKVFPQMSGTLNVFIKALQRIDPAAVAAKKGLAGIGPASDWDKKFNSAWNAVNKFFRDSGRGIKSLRDDFDSNMRLIQSTVGLHSAAGANLMRTNVNKMVAAVLDGMKKGRINTVDGLKAINDALDKGVKSGAITWTQRWKTMFNTLADLYKHHKIDIQDYLKQINEVIDQMTKKGGKHFTDNLKDAFNTVTDLYRKHKINTRTWNDEIGKIMKTGAENVKNTTTQQYQQAMANLKQKLHDGTITHQQFNKDVAALNADRNRKTHGSMSNFAAMFVAGYANAHNLSAPELQHLIDDTNNALRKLHAAPIGNLQVSVGRTTNSIAQAALSIPKALGFAAQGGDMHRLMAAGGLAPGREFGLNDHMTLVDPTGRPRAKMAGDEGILTRYQMPVVNKALSLAKRVGQSAYGSLQEVWSNVKRPHGYATGGELPGFAQGGQLPGFAGGGTLSYGQLESLWDQAGGPSNLAALMAAIAEAESGGDPGAHNPSGATGLWQILGNPFSGNAYDPLTNARMAVAKWRSQGLAAWQAYTNGAYRQFLHGNVPPNAAGIGGAVNVPTIKAPHVSGNKTLADMLNAQFKDVTTAANKYIQAHAPVAPAGGAINSSFIGKGPGGVGSYRGVRMANWVIDSLRYAAAHGSGDPQPTSGYRPGYDPHTATGSSEHAGTQYPHGAVDFGGYSGPGVLQKKMSVVHATSGFTMPLLAPIGFQDDGHASGTGHQLGGLLSLLLPGFAGGGNVWRVRASAEDSSSGRGWTELSTNGNAAARSGHPRTASHQGGWDFSTLGRHYPRGTQLRITNFAKHRTGTFPETDVGDGSSFAPAVGLTPAVRAFLGFPTDPYWSGTVDIQFPHGNINLASGFGRLMSSGGGSGHNKPVDPLTRRERQELNRLTRQRDSNKHFSTKQEKRWEYLEKKAHRKLPKPHDATRLTGAFKNIPDLAALDDIKTDYWDAWLGALDNQAGLISTIGGEADPYTGDPHLALLASGNPSDLALVNPRPAGLEDAYTDPILGDIKIPFPWPQFPAGTNIVDAQMADVFGEIALNQGKVEGLERLTGPKLRDLNDSQGIIGQALLERKHRQMRIERVLAADLKLTNHIRHRMSQIDNDLRAMSIGDARHRLEMAIGADRRNARVRATRDSLDLLRQHKQALQNELRDEKATHHPDPHVVRHIEAQISHADTMIAREERHLSQLEQQPHSGTDTAYENLIKTTLRDEKKTLNDSLKPITDEMQALGGSRTSVGKKGFWGQIQGDMDKLRAKKKEFGLTISDVQSQTIPGLQLQIRDLQTLKKQQGIIDWSTLNKPEQQYMDVFDYWLAQIQGGIKPDGLQADDAAASALAAYLSGQSGGAADVSVGQIAAQLLQGKTPDGLIVEDQTVPASAASSNATPEQDPTAWEGPFEVTVYKDMLSVWRQRLDEAKASMGYPGGATFPQLTSIQGNINTLQDSIKQIMDGYAAQNGASSGTASAADIAAAAYQDFLGYQNAQQQLFTQFGSNFVRQGANPFATQGGRDAGVRFYGAASGFARGGDMLRVMLEQQQPSGSGPISITNHFGGGPGDPHTWAASQRHEVMALMGRR